MNLNVIKGDITKVYADAIVNAANQTLHHGGGVCGAIHTAAGPGLLAWNSWMYPNGTSTSVPVASPAFELPAKYVLHVPGPDAREIADLETCPPKISPQAWAKADEALWLAYSRTLVLAGLMNVGTVTFPSLSTGIFGFPLERAVPLAIDALRESASRAPSVHSAAIVAFDDVTFNAFKDAL